MSEIIKYLFLGFTAPFTMSSLEKEMRKDRARFMRKYRQQCQVVRRERRNLDQLILDNPWEDVGSQLYHAIEEVNNGRTQKEENTVSSCFCSK